MSSSGASLFGFFSPRQKNTPHLAFPILIDGFNIVGASIRLRGDAQSLGTHTNQIPLTQSSGFFNPFFLRWWKVKTEVGSKWPGLICCIMSGLGCCWVSSVTTRLFFPFFTNHPSGELAKEMSILTPREDQPPVAFKTFVWFCWLMDEDTVTNEPGSSILDTVLIPSRRGWQDGRTGALF